MPARLHATLSRSPLFTKIDNALYKLRGQAVTARDIERAENVAERTALDLDIEYRITGEIVIACTLGSLAVATGTIVSNQLPNLVGQWKLAQFSRVIEVTDTEIRHLRTVFEELECTIGSRVQLSFDTWKRVVSVSQIGDLHEN